MSIPSDILTMVDRLKRANIPFDHLCYEVDEGEWRELLEYMESFQRYTNCDLSYVDDVSIMGLHVRKRIGLGGL